MAMTTSTIVKITAVVGAEVSEGELVVVLEAMKMEFLLWLDTPGTGTLQQISPDHQNSVALKQLA